MQMHSHLCHRQKHTSNKTPRSHAAVESEASSCSARSRMTNASLNILTACKIVKKIRHFIHSLFQLLRIEALSIFFSSCRRIYESSKLEQRAKHLQDIESLDILTVCRKKRCEASRITVLRGHCSHEKFDRQQKYWIKNIMTWIHFKDISLLNILTANRNTG